MAVFKPPCSCGHPHSLHDTGWDAAGCMHQSCSCRSYAEANLAFERRVLDDVELAALREENARLRQRVEELEEMYSSLGRNYDSLEKRAEAAEAKVARCVEAIQRFRAASDIDQLVRQYGFSDAADDAWQEVLAAAKGE